MKLSCHQANKSMPQQFISSFVIIKWNPTVNSSDTRYVCECHISVVEVLNLIHHKLQLLIVLSLLFLFFFIFDTCSFESDVVLSDDTNTYIDTCSMNRGFSYFGLGQYQLNAFPVDIIERRYRVSPFIFWLVHFLHIPLDFTCRSVTTSRLQQPGDLSKLLIQRGMCN